MATVSSEAELMMTKCSDATKMPKNYSKQTISSWCQKPEASVHMSATLKLLLRKWILAVVLLTWITPIPNSSWFILQPNLAHPQKMQKGVRKIEVPMHGNILVRHAFRWCETNQSINIPHTSIFYCLYNMNTPAYYGLRTNSTVQAAPRTDSSRIFMNLFVTLCPLDGPGTELWIYLWTMITINFWNANKLSLNHLLGTSDMDDWMNLTSSLQSNVYFISKLEFLLCTLPSRDTSKKIWTF